MNPYESSLNFYDYHDSFMINRIWERSREQWLLDRVSFPFKGDGCPTIARLVASTMLVIGTERTRDLKPPTIDKPDLDKMYPLVMKGG